MKISISSNGVRAKMGPENDLQSVKWSVHLENEGRYVW